MKYNWTILSIFWLLSAVKAETEEDVSVTVSSSEDEATQGDDTGEDLSMKLDLLSSSIRGFEDELYKIKSDLKAKEAEKDFYLGAGDSIGPVISYLEKIINNKNNLFENDNYLTDEFYSTIKNNIVFLDQVISPLAKAWQALDLMNNTLAVNANFGDSEETTILGGIMNNLAIAWDMADEGLKELKKLLELPPVLFNKKRAMKVVNDHIPEMLSAIKGIVENLYYLYEQFMRERAKRIDEEIIKLENKKNKLAHAIENKKIELGEADLRRAISQL